MLDPSHKLRPIAYMLVVKCIIDIFIGMVLLNCNCLSVHLCGEVLPFGRTLLIRISCYSSAVVGVVFLWWVG